MKKYLKNLVPNFLKAPARNLLDSSRHVIDKLNYGGMVPPRSMNYVGDGVFLKTGLEFKDYFLNIGNLKSHERVLDIGSGMGRMAVPLTGFLSREGGYWGFDIIEKGIDWCQKHITPKFRNFHFQHSNVYNKHYNPQGIIRANEFRFPFEDWYFDFVFLTSVFTHMLPLDLENYLSEISRVLKPGGRCMVTFFILNQQSEKLVKDGKSTLNFQFTLQPGCKTTTESDPEAAIAYDEGYIRVLFNRYGLRIQDPIHFGSWCKRDEFLSYQDIVFAMKNGSGN
jgi:ubiquinone/menaquinone biosynthesis C-methylase UbiE